MVRFTDNTGREWTLRLTVGLLAKLRVDAQFDLSLAIRSSQGLVEFLFQEPDTIVKALWVICADQAKTLGITPEEFGYLFDGSTLEAAAEAMLESIADFFPRQKVAAKLKANLKGELARMDQAILNQLDSTSKSIAGSLPESSASTPTPARSEN